MRKPKSEIMMTQISNPKSKFMKSPQSNQFDYVKIGIASPGRIRKWGERTLPNG